MNLNRDDGCSPLYIAAKNGHVETIKVLLRSGAQVEQSSDKINPLYVAAQNGFAEIVRVLLLHETARHAPSPTFGRANGGNRRRRPFGLRPRRRRGSNDLILDADRRSRRRSVVSVATAVGHSEIVNMLLEAGAHVNAVDGEDDGDANSSLPLFIAAKRGNAKIVATLLNAGARVNVRRHKDGLTPLHMAVKRGHHDVVDALLRAGAKPNVTCHDGRTPMREAVSRRDVRSVAMLLRCHEELGMDVDESSVLDACALGDVRVVTTLLKSDRVGSAVRQRAAASCPGEAQRIMRECGGGVLD